MRHVKCYKGTVDLNQLVEMHFDTLPPDLIIVERAGPRLPDTQEKIAELLWSGLMDAV